MATTASTTKSFIKSVNHGTKKEWNKPTYGVRYNGLLKTEHLIAALNRFGPMNSQKLWETVKDVSGIESKRKMKKLLVWLQDKNRVFTSKDKSLLTTSYIYSLNPVKKRNNMSYYPENYPEEMEKIGRFAFKHEKSLIYFFSRPWRPPTPKEKVSPIPLQFSKSHFPKYFPEARRPKKVWFPPPPPPDWLHPPNKNDPKYFNPKEPFLPEPYLSTFLKNQSERPKLTKLVERKTQTQTQKQTQKK